VSAIIALADVDDTNADLVSLVGLVNHGTVLEDTRVAVALPDIGLGVAVDGGDFAHSGFSVLGVLAGLEPDHAAALPGVHLVVPAVVVELDVAEELVLVVVPVLEGVVGHVLLDAEVPETSSVERVLVDSAALVRWALWVNLVLEAGDVTERAALAITIWLFAVKITPDLSGEFLVCGILAFLDFFSFPVVTVYVAGDVISFAIKHDLAFIAFYVAGIS